MNDALVVWRLLDGKPGHEKQSLGLLQGLAALAPVAAYELDMRHKSMFWGEVRRHVWGEAMLPPPHLIVGVGHATHLPMLAARAACGGRTVVLMKPSLPLALFDLIFVPRHDHYPRKGNVVGTWGVICPTTDEGKVADEGLVLIGGPNRTYDWQPDAVAGAVGAIADASPEIRWTACDSRRTPAGLAERVSPRDNLAWQSWRRAPQDFLQEALARASYVWVTADSVSMLYEALSARAQVGIIAMPTRRPNAASKYARGIEALRERRHVLASEDGYRIQDSRLSDFRPENRRCAEIVLERLVQPV